ncbi:hypothetical protein BHE74_00047091, partial [Ensete ventricosum]
HLTRNTISTQQGRERERERETQLSKGNKYNATEGDRRCIIFFSILRECRGREEERGDGEDRTVEEAPPDPTRPETPLVLFATSRHCPSTRRRCSSPLVVKIVAVLGLQGPDER